MNVTCISKVLDTTLRISRGGHQDVKLQFTIPFVNQHKVRKLNRTGMLYNDQSMLYINLGVHNGSVECSDLGRKMCDYKVMAYKRQESDKYNTDDWKVIHNIRVYNKDDGDFAIIDKHITLRFETGRTDGVGSKIFENLVLPDIQVFYIILINLHTFNDLYSYF